MSHEAIKPLTVAEIIAVLQRLPPDAHLGVHGCMEHPCGGPAVAVASNHITPNTWDIITSEACGDGYYLSSEAWIAVR